MKRLCIIVALFLLTQVFLLTCAGYSSTLLPEPNLLPLETFNSTEDFFAKYPEIEKRLSHRFLYYEDFKSLGKFVSLTIKWDSTQDIEGLYSYTYTLQDKYGRNTSIEIIVKRDNIGIVFDYITKYESDYLGEISSVKGGAVKCKNAVYWYKETDDPDKLTLLFVTFFDEFGNRYEIITDWKNESVPASDPFVRLMYSESNTEAVNEIIARLNGTYVAPWVYPTAICGGAVLLAAAVAVPTVILRRKKRNAAADADIAPAPDESEDTQA